MHKARWILFLPAAFFVIPWILLLGVVFSSLLQRFCDPEDFHRGGCIADWYLESVVYSMVLFAALTAVSMVYVGVKVAPSHKFIAGVVTYVAGSILLFLFVGGAGASVFPVAMIGAPLICGAICLFWLKRKLDV